MSSRSRPRRKAAIAANAGLKEVLPAVAADPDADPEFIALSAKQRKAIDKAFARGLNLAGGRSRKRRRLNGEKGKAKAEDTAGGGFFDDDGQDTGGGGFLDGVEDGGGGFVDDDMDGGGGGFVDDDADMGGGFVDDDDIGGGGFLPEEEDGGGFLQEDSLAGPSVPKSNSTSRPLSTDRSAEKIPLHVLPGLLGSLGLPSDDDVLEVFKASASGWDESDTRRRKKGQDEEILGVERKDFRAVCAALMGPEQGGDDNLDQGEEGQDDDEQEEEDEDAFELSADEDSDSALSSLSTASDYGGTAGAVKGPGKGRGRRTANKVKDLKEDSAPTRLSSRQQEMVADLWKMVKPDGGEKRGGRILGKDEVRKLVRDLGEMWTDEEIAEMVTLFSTQHEGRGLSYEDFGTVMLKAGLV